MRQGNQPQGQKRGRNRGNGGRRNAHRQSFDSNGPNVRIRGTATQIYDKYVALARDAASSGDRVLAENLLQHADHYFRLSAPVGDQGPQRRPEEDRSARGDHPGQDDDEDQVATAEQESASDPVKATSGRGRRKDRAETQAGPVLMNSEAPSSPAELAAAVAAAEDDNQTERVAAGD